MATLQARSISVRARFPKENTNDAYHLSLRRWYGRGRSPHIARSESMKDESQRVAHVVVNSYLSRSFAARICSLSSRSISLPLMNDNDSDDSSLPVECSER